MDRHKSNTVDRLDLFFDEKWLIAVTVLIAATIGNVIYEFRPKDTYVVTGTLKVAPQREEVLTGLVRWYAQLDWNYSNATEVKLEVLELQHKQRERIENDLKTAIDQANSLVIERDQIAQRFASDLVLKPEMALQVPETMAVLAHYPYFLATPDIKPIKLMSLEFENKSISRSRPEFILSFGAFGFAIGAMIALVKRLVINRKAKGLVE